MSYAGFLSDTDICEAIASKEMAISPYNEENLTPVGYNFSYSRFIISLSTKTFKKIYIDKNNTMYFILVPNESVVVLTTEAIWVSREIGGTFHSKVSIVAKGIGHISTTLDPGWQGQLLIPMNNPTKKRIKVEIGRIVISNDEHDDIIYKYNTFITLVLFKSISPSTKISRNRASRYDILNDIIKSSKYLFNNKIINAVNLIKSEIIRNQISFDSGDRSENINKFNKLYDNISQLLDIYYNKEINLKSNINYYTFKVTLCVILIIMPIVLVLAIKRAISSDEAWKWIVSILTPIWTLLFFKLTEKLKTI